MNWYANKEKCEIGHYINNKKDGEWVYMSENGEKILDSFFLRGKKYKHGTFGIQSLERRNKFSMIVVLKFLSYVGTRLGI